MHKISLLVPTLNEEKNISNFLESVVSQTKIPEVVICDGGSKDRTIEIIKEYQRKCKKIKLVQINQKGTGIAINKAFENSSGEYILHCGADWRFNNHKTFEIIEKYFSNGDWLAFSSKILPKENLDIFKNSIRIWDSRKGTIGFSLIKRDFFPTYPHASYGEDRIASKKILEKKPKIVYISKRIEFERGNYENFTLRDFIRRYIWYGKTFHLYLKEIKDPKENLRIIFDALCVVFPPLLLIPALYGFYIALRFIKTYPPTLIMFPLFAALSTFLMGVGYIKHFFDKDLNIGH